MKRKTVLFVVEAMEVAIVLPVPLEGYAIAQDIHPEDGNSTLNPGSLDTMCEGLHQFGHELPEPQNSSGGGDAGRRL